MSDLETSAPAEILDKIGAKFGFPGQSPEAATEEQQPEHTEVAEQTETPLADGLADLEWEGQSFKVPPSLKSAVMRNDDYTKKTQALADERRSIEQVKALAESALLEKTFSESIAQEQQEIGIIDAYLGQMRNIDWSQLSSEQMLKQKIELDNIKERRASLLQSLEGKRAKFTQDVQARIIELRSKAREIASQSITGFNEETEKTIRDYAKSEGLNEQEIDNVLLDPRSFKVIWKAAQYDKIKAGTTQAADKAAKVLKPGAAGVKMPQETASKLNFAKEMKAAKTSGQKAAVIEDRLAKVFSKR